MVIMFFERARGICALGGATEFGDSISIKGGPSWRRHIRNDDNYCRASELSRSSTAAARRGAHPTLSLHESAGHDPRLAQSWCHAWLHVEHEIGLDRGMIAEPAIEPVVVV